MNVPSNESPLPSGIHVGYVHLRVSDLDRAAAFYRDVIGLTVTPDLRTFVVPVLFMETYASIAMRVPQWMVASYLGISPETVSRIRKRASQHPPK